MEYTKRLEIWVRGEVLQARIMIGFGFISLLVFIFILQNDDEILRGMLIPLGLALVVLLGYGSFVLINRRQYFNNQTANFQKTPEEAIHSEIEKQTKDYNSCRTLTRIYPVLMIIATLFLNFMIVPYYKGMAIGFIMLFITAFLIDKGFMSRSRPFLVYLKTN